MADTFTPDQIGELRERFAKIETVDPGGPGYAGVVALLDKMTQAQLAQVAGAGIKFLSKLANNRVKQ